MTKVTIIGETTPQEIKGEKKIQFKYCISDKGQRTSCDYSTPDQWSNIELITRGYTKGGLDLMFAYADEDRNSHDETCLFLGHFNDGIV